MKIRSGGFTLVEIMIVVTIIGILAAIAIPNFLSYQSKARQSEVKMHLQAIHSAQSTYFAENDTYTDNFFYLPWKAEGVLRYTYSLGPNPANLKGQLPPMGVPELAPTPGASREGFTCVAYANIDKDPTIDTWYVTNNTFGIVTRNDVGTQ